MDIHPVTVVEFRLSSTPAAGSPLPSGSRRCSTCEGRTGFGPCGSGWNDEINDEGGGARTHDLGIKSPLLYQLSYAPDYARNIVQANYLHKTP
jgi:hypothetical protein